MDEQKHLAKPKEIATKNKSGNPDTTNNSLTHPEEMLDNETLQASTRSSHDGRGQAKAQTELMCAVPQVEHILNMCLRNTLYVTHSKKTFQIKHK